MKTNFNARFLTQQFFFSPLSPNIFGYYRIGIGLLAILLCGLLYPGLYLIFGQNGLIIWDITDRLANPLQPTIGRIHQMIGKDRIDADFLLYAFFWVYLMVLALFTVGWKTRIMAVLAWIMHLALMNTCRFGSYGVESMLNIALFYAIFFPCGEAMSFDSRGKPNAEPNAYARLCLRVFQFQLCLIYVSSGVEKLFGQEWWDGNAIWYSLNEEQFKQFDFSWLAQFPIVAKLISWWTLFIETFYIIGIWVPLTRRFWLYNTVLLHLGIGLFMGLHTFATIMILFNFFAFWLPYRREKPVFYFKKPFFAQKIPT